MVRTRNTGLLRIIGSMGSRCKGYAANPQVTMA